MAGNGVIQMGSSAALPSTTDVVFDLTGTGSSTTLDLNGNNEQVNSLSSNTNLSGFSITNNQLSSTATLAISGTTSPANPFSGRLLDGAGVMAISKSGTGTLWLTGSNNYSGGTNIYGGTLRVGNTSATGNGPVYVNNGGVLAASTGVVTVNGPVTVYGGGVLLSPGYQTGSGTLNILNGLTLAPSSSVNFDLG